ncbi:MAG: filamentous hemagglutinin N-terminal domain-containing protein, partial [Cyanobacteria bacterium J06639_18]
MLNISISQVSPFSTVKGKIHWLAAIVSLVSCSLPIYSERAIADIIADDTLPNNTVVLTPNGNSIEITGGTRPENGSNLFHSFTNFSLQSNETARFIHESGIQNIITRITGGSLSNIDGTIQTLIDGTTDNKGSANFFIINPSGIIFGENAKLDIGGSFFASTAESIKFADGSFYSAVNSQGTSLLTIDVPMGLQYGSNSGDITVRGPGSNIFFDFDTFSTDRSDRTLGLQVLPGKTLALVGGNVILSGGNLTAEQGRVELGSVQGEGFVTLNSTTSGWNLDYEQVNNFQDINLTAAASIDVSGNGGGEVQVVGRNISLTNGSAILANTDGDSTGKILSIKATEALEVVGFSFDLPLSTTISTDVEFGATGNAGEIQIDAKSLIVDGGGQIGSGTFGTGNGGTIRVKAEDIELNFGGPFGPSGLFTNAAFGTGNGGQIFIETDRLLVNEGATISSGNSFNSDGDAGNLNIKAQDIQLVSAAFGQFPSGLSASGLFTSTQGDADAGNLDVNTRDLS